jgi:hypothetical protein
VATKQIFPIYEAEELASANTEDILSLRKDPRQYRTKREESFFFSAFWGYAAIPHCEIFSLTGRVQLFTEDGAIKGVITDQGKIKGQDVVLNIGKRLDTTAGSSAINISNNQLQIHSGSI